MKSRIKNSFVTLTSLSLLVSSQLVKAQSIDPTPDPNIEVHVRGYLKAVNAALKTPVSQMPVDQARGTYDYATSVGDKPDLSGIEESEKTITLDGRPIILNIVRPKGVTKTIPAFLYFHGGVWILGDYASHRTLLRDLVVASGYAAVFVNYSRSPEAKFPQANNEAYAATEWLSEHGRELNIDGNSIAVGGNSVGGNMATVVALMAKDKGKSFIKFQFLISPVTDANFDTPSYLQYADGRFLTRDLMIKGWDSYLPDAGQRKQIYASPLQASVEQLKGLPPALVITEENDVLRDEGEAYARKLDEAGVWVTATRYNSLVHDFVVINALHGLPATRAAILQVANALKDNLK
jgi:acetyl esterase/lipase